MQPWSVCLTFVYVVLQALKHNGSLYAHVYFARSGYPVDPTDPEYEQKSAFGRTHRTCSVSHCMFFLYMIIYIYGILIALYLSFSCRGILAKIKSW